MKASSSIKIFMSSIFGLLMIMSFESIAQEEYDDMYFTPKDRKEVKKEPVNFSSGNEAVKTGSQQVINPEYSAKQYGDVDDNYSAGNVNPEYIERYKTNSKDNEEALEEAQGDSYYVENYDRDNFTDDTLESNNNYYDRYDRRNSNYGWNDPWGRQNYYGRSFYDPFWGPSYMPGWNMGMGNSFGYMPGWSLTLSYGSAWGYDPWYSSGFYRPWYSRPYYNAWAYDPWYYDSWMGYGYPYRSSFYHGYNTGFYSGFYSGYYGGGYYNNIGEKDYAYSRRVARGSSNITRSDAAVPNRRTAIAQRSGNDGQAVDKRARSDRDYSRTQNEYYAESRSRYAYDRTSGSTGSEVNTRADYRTNARNATPNVRSSRSTTDYSRPNYRSAGDSRARTSSSYNTNRSSSRSSYSDRNYQQSRSSSRSYSTPARSGSSSSLGRSSSSYSSGSRSSSSSPARSSSSSGSSGSSGRGRR